MRVKADGSGDPERPATGKFKKGGDTWFYWIRQPVVSPDGKTSRWSPTARTRPRATSSSSSSTSTTKKSTVPDGRPRSPPLGHQDPAWRPDGKYLLYVRNGRDGRAGAPIIYRCDVAKKTSAAVDRARATSSRRSRPTASTSRRPRPTQLRHRRRDPRRRNGRELLRITNDGASWAPAWSPTGDAHRVPPHRRPDRRPEAGRLDGDAPNWTVKDDDRPDRGLRPRRLVAARTGSSRPTSCPRRPPTPSRARAASVERRRPAPRDGRRTSSDSRPGRRPSAASSASGSTRTRPRCPTGFSRGPRRRRAVRAGSSSRRPAPYAAAVKPNLAFFEAFGSAGMAALERIRAPIPADLPVVADAKRGDIGTTAARQAVALFDGLGADAVTVNPYLGRRGDRAAPRARRTASPTSCAGPRTRAPAELQDLDRRRGPGDRRARPSRSTLASPGSPRGWGPGGTVGLVVGATAPAELARDPGRRARVSAFLVPGRRRPGRRRRAGPRATGRRPRRRPAGGRAADCSSTCRGASPARRSASPRRRSARPRRAPRGGRPRLGFADSLCYPKPRRTGHAARHATGRSDGPPTSRSNDDHAEHRTPRADHHPGDRAPHPRPGQAARRRGRRSARASGIPQGVVGRPGSGEVKSTPRRCRATPAAAAAPAAGCPGRAAAVAAGARRRRGRRRQPPSPPPSRAAPGRAARRVARRDRRLVQPSPASRAPLDPTDGRRRRPARPGVTGRPERHPTRAAAARRRARRRVGHVARRPPRRAAHPPVPVDPRGRASASVVGFYVADRRSATSWPTPTAGDGHAAGPRARRRVRHPAQDLARRRDHPGDAGPALPGLGVHRARA